MNSTSVTETFSELPKNIAFLEENSFSARQSSHNRGYRLEQQHEMDPYDEYFNDPFDGTFIPRHAAETKAYCKSAT